MDKYFMRFFETEEEYKQAKPNLQYKTLSAIKETKNVYYNVDIHHPYAVIINGGEEVHIFEDGIIPINYFKNRTDISNVEIRSGINTISDCAFERCTSLNTITINGNISIIGDYAFSIGSSLHTINYYGNIEPMHSISFLGKSKPTINVTEDYEGEKFLRKTVNKVL